jgi:voltage-gated potassium channel
MPQARDVYRRLALLGAALAALLIAGTVAYSLAEHRNLWDAFVWAIDTVATTGADRAPTDTAGEIVKVVLTFLGVGTLFYVLIALTELVVTGELGTILSERRMRRMTERLRDHYIVCGFGRVGRQVARDLRAAGALYVVVDDDPANREAAYAPGVRFILARPSDDDALRDAGIARARAVMACVDSDAENIFIALTARELRPDIAIVARASQEEAES